MSTFIFLNNFLEFDSSCKQDRLQKKKKMFQSFFLSQHLFSSLLPPLSHHSLSSHSWPVVTNSLTFIISRDTNIPTFIQNILDDHQCFREIKTFFFSVSLTFVHSVPSPPLFKDVYVFYLLHLFCKQFCFKIHEEKNK